MLSRTGLWLARIAMAAVLLAALALLARLPQGAPPQEAVLRLAWRSAGERVTTCRDYTEAEMRNLPEHMRRDQHCEQSLVSYRLRAWVDGEQLLDQRVEPGGLRGDRPLFVHETLPLAPGEHRLRVEFLPAEAVGELPTEGSCPLKLPGLSSAGQAPQARAYCLERTVEAGVGRVVMVDLDEGAQRLYLRGRRDG